MIKIFFLISVTFSFYTDLFGSFSNKISDFSSNLGGKISNQFNSLTDKINPFAPDPEDELLENCNHEYNLKSLFPFIPLDELVCKPVHAEFSRKGVGLAVIWIFDCVFLAPVLN